MFNSTIQKILAVLLSTSSLLVPSTFAQEASESPAASGIPQNKNAALTANTLFKNGEKAAVSLSALFLDPINEKKFRGFFGENNPNNPNSALVGRYRFTPLIDIKAGDNGLFQSVVGKFSGEFMFINVKPFDNNYAELDLPMLHVFPISIGAETTRQASSYAILGEIGYVPIYPIGNSKTQNFVLGINPLFGVYFQGGYKFDGNKTTLKGGSRDQSSEPINDEILRIKTNFNFTYELPELPGFDTEFSPKLITWATAWYDIAHKDFYHSVGVKLRFNLPGQKNKHFDFTVEDGSGEPNFNKGTQFGAGLTITF